MNRRLTLLSSSLLNRFCLWLLMTAVLVNAFKECPDANHKLSKCCRDGREKIVEWDGTEREITTICEFRPTCHFSVVPSLSCHIAIFPTRVGTP